MRRAIFRCGFLALFVFLMAKGVAAADGGWSYYGGDPGGTRYSPLTQITPANVRNLEVAWTYRTGDMGAGFPGDEWKSHMTFEATPILYDGTLYFTTSETNVVAVNAATGGQRWRFDTHEIGRASCRERV